MGTEIAIGLCKAAITYELGIKRPLVGTEILIGSGGSIQKCIIRN